VADVKGIRGLSAEYEHLYRVTGNTLPFATQEWHLAWCEHLLSHTRRASQEPLFCILRKGDGGCTAIVPLILTRRRLGPLSVSALGLVGADPALTQIRNPLVEPGYERATVRAVHERLAELRGWDWIQWSGISAALAQALSLEATPQWYQTLYDCVLDLPADWAQFSAKLRREVRESLRHCYDSLRLAGHNFEFVVARDRVEVRWALHRFLQLQTLRANFTSMLVHDLRAGGRAAEHPWQDEAYAAAHGGLWRAPYSPRSALTRPRSRSSQLSITSSKQPSRMRRSFSGNSRTADRGAIGNPRCVSRRINT